MQNIINLCPEMIFIFRSGEPQRPVTFPPSGAVAQILKQRNLIRLISEHCIELYTETVLSDVVGIPDADDGATFYIVTDDVRKACPNDRRLISPYDPTYLHAANRMAYRSFISNS